MLARPILSQRELPKTETRLKVLSNFCRLSVFETSVPGVFEKVSICSTCRHYTSQIKIIPHVTKIITLCQTSFLNLILIKMHFHMEYQGVLSAGHAKQDI